MDAAIIKDTVLRTIHKNKYMVFIVVLGLVLMLLPGISKEETKEEIQQEVVSEQKLSDQLEHILCQISGAGDVQVLLTQSKGKSTVYQTDTKTSDQSMQVDTVIIKDSQRGESGLVCQEIPPTYLGAIIVCRGGDKASVRLAIVEAVSKVTGLGADQISVLKMK